MNKEAVIALFLYFLFTASDAVTVQKRGAVSCPVLWSSFFFFFQDAKEPSTVEEVFLSQLDKAASSVDGPAYRQCREGGWLDLGK